MCIYILETQAYTAYEYISLDVQTSINTHTHTQAQEHTLVRTRSLLSIFFFAKAL